MMRPRTSFAAWRRGSSSPIRGADEGELAMKLDRYTEKAQEAILRAQRLATDANATSLDVEHLLAALLEDDDGIPATTLRRIGADPQSLRVELGAVLAGRAKGYGTQMGADPRLQHALQAAEEEARRLGDEYVSTEHLLLAAAVAGGDAQRLLDAAGAGREALLRALTSVRGGQR